MAAEVVFTKGTVEGFRATLEQGAEQVCITDATVGGIGTDVVVNAFTDTAGSQL